MRNITLLLLASMMLSVFMSCKKDKAETAQYDLAFSRRALEYVRLTEGKYFIYKDSATLQLDSVIVTKSKLDNIFTGAGFANGQPMPPYNHESFELTLSKFVGSSKTEWFDGIADLTMNSYPTAHSDTAAALYLDGSIGNTTSVLFFSFQDNYTPNYIVTVEGRTYNNVVITLVDPFGADISNPYYIKSTIYWAKGIGIIKQETRKAGGIIKTYTLLRNN